MNNIRQDKYKITMSISIPMLAVLFMLTRFGFVFFKNSAVISIRMVIIVGLFGAFIFMLSTGAKLKGYVIPLIIHAGFITFVWLFQDSGSNRDIPYNYLCQMLLILVLLFAKDYMTSSDKKTRIFLIRWYLIGVAASSIYTSYVVFNSGSDSIIRATAYGVMDSAYRLNYGGFGFIYSLVVLYPFILTILHRKKIQNRKTKFLLIGLIVLIAFTVLVSSYTTAFVLILLFTLWELISNKYWRIALIGFVILGLYVFPQYLTEIIRNIPFIPELTSTRINETILSLTHQSVSRYFTVSGERFDRMGWSLQVFLENPLFGGLLANNVNHYGAHTQWIDDLAKYGLIAESFLVCFFVKYFRNVKIQDNYSSLVTTCTKNTMFIFILLGFLNPMEIACTIAPVFVLCPFADDFD